MKVVQDKNEVESSGDLAQSNFGIEWNSKIARMLSEQIYSDPILAVVREYTCNAWDAHKMVGKEAQPIEIHLPTALEPHWSVRDFGPGLSQAQIMGTKENDFKGLFNTYGKSGKDDSNLFIGGFGMGSKAGFAYTKQDSAFTVTSWHEGIKHCFTAHMDANGIPNIVMMLCEASSEPSGVEISIPVKTKDINTFTEHTAKVCAYAKVIPKFTGDILEITPRTYEQEGDGWRRARIGSYHSGSVAIIGGIAYPINSNQFSDTARMVCSSGIELDVPIGEVELSLSRESLSYDNRTIEYLTRRFEKANEEIGKLYAEAFKDKKSYWEKCLIYSKYHNDPLIQTHAVKIKHKGRVLTNKLQVDSRRMYKAYFEIASVTNYSLSDSNSRHRFQQSWSGYISQNIYLVWNDGTSTRLQPKYNRLKTLVPENATILLVKTPSRRVFKRVWAKLGGCPNVIHLNSLENLVSKEEEDRIKRDKTDLKRNVSYLVNGYSASRRRYFDSIEIDFGRTDPVYYIWCKGYVLYQDPECQTKGIGPDALVRALIGLKEYDEDETKSIWSKKIYCIPGIYECHVEGKTNFINVCDLIKETKLPDDVLTLAAQYEEESVSKITQWSDGFHRHLMNQKEYKNTDLCQKVEDVIKASRRGKERNALKRYQALKNVHEMLGLPGQELPVLPKEKLIDFDKYPMLSVMQLCYYFSDKQWPTVVKYIQECESKDVLPVQST